jgi:hypothetical protein
MKGYIITYECEGVICTSYITAGCQEHAEWIFKDYCPELDIITIKED